MRKAVKHTRFLEEPIDLALTDPVVIGTMEPPKPVPCTIRVRAGIKEIESKEMGLGPGTRDHF